MLKMQLQFNISNIKSTQQKTPNFIKIFENSDLQANKLHKDFFKSYTQRKLNDIVKNSIEELRTEYLNDLHHVSIKSKIGNLKIDGLNSYCKVKIDYMETQRTLNTYKVLEDIINKLYNIIDVKMSNYGLFIMKKVIDKL